VPDCDGVGGRPRDSVSPRSPLSSRTSTSPIHLGHRAPRDHLADRLYHRRVAGTGSARGIRSIRRGNARIAHTVGAPNPERLRCGRSAPDPAAGAAFRHDRHPLDAQWSHQLVAQTAPRVALEAVGRLERGLRSSGGLLSVPCGEVRSGTQNQMVRTIFTGMVDGRPCVVPTTPPTGAVTRADRDLPERRRRSDGLRTRRGGQTRAGCLEVLGRTARQGVWCRHDGRLAGQWPDCFPIRRVARRWALQPVRASARASTARMEDHIGCLRGTGAGTLMTPTPHLLLTYDFRRWAAHRPPDG
jgi:hypothetical protein